MGGNLKRWTKVGGASDGSLVKFDKAGQTLEGIWHGTRPGRFGDLGMMTLTSGEQVSFPIHTALVDKVKKLRDGAEVQIVYTGMQKSKTGREFKGFEVSVADVQMLLTVADEEQDHPAEPDDDVPF